MPNSNGYDRNNYSTTFNFSKSPQLKRSTIINYPKQRSSHNSEKSVQSRPNLIKRQYSKRETDRVSQFDSSVVHVPDPDLREIIEKLVFSEKDRLVKNIDSNLITQINHNGMSLYFTRNAKNPFEKRTQRKKIESKSTQTNIFLPPIDTNSQSSIKLNENENKTVQLPVEVDQFIQQDLINNPLTSGERSYKIVINKNVTKPGSESQIVRVIVKASIPLINHINQSESNFLPPIVQKNLESTNNTNYGDVSNKYIEKN